MADISYNAEVTADDLNNIAVDLGAVNFSTFKNSIPYAVSQLNGITAALVTKGILLSDSGNMCEAVIQNDAVCIQPGTIVFGNGAKMKITEAVAVELISNTYIYALLNTTTNTSQIVVSEVQPEVGDYVMLAKISSAKNAIDLRTLSKAHVPLPTEILSTAIPVNVTGDMILNNPQITVNMAGSDKLFIVRNTNNLRADVFAVFDKSTGTFTGYQAGDYDNASLHIVHGVESIKTYDSRNTANGTGDVSLKFYSIDGSNVIFDIVLEGKDSGYPQLFNHGYMIYVLGGVSE